MVFKLVRSTHADTFGSSTHISLPFGYISVHFSFQEILAFSGVRDFELLSKSADHFRLLSQANHQGNSVFSLQKVCYAKSCIKATDAINYNLNGSLIVTNFLKKARKLLKKKVARNPKSYSKD